MDPAYSSCSVANSSVYSYPCFPPTHPFTPSGRQGYTHYYDYTSYGDTPYCYTHYGYTHYGCTHCGYTQIWQVALVPGEAFGAPSTIRLSYAATRANIGDAVAKLATFLTELK